MTSLSIEFYCHHCEAFLRAPETKAGLSIGCPHCGSRLWVPLESAAFEDIHELEFSENSEDELVYTQEDFEVASSPRRQPSIDQSHETLLCIRCDTPRHPGKKICKQCGHRVGTPKFLEPDEIDLGKILSTSWRLFTRHYWSCLTVTFTDTLLTIAACVISIIIGGMAAVMAGNQPESIILFFFIGTGLGWSVAMSMFALGHIRFYLHLCRTENPEFRESMSFQGPIGALLVGGVVYWSLFLFIFPSIFLWPFGRIIVDQQTSAPRGLWTALRLTTKHAGICLVLFVIKVGAFLTANMIPGVGLILLTPYFAILNTVAYLHFIGELE